MKTERKKGKPPAHESTAPWEPRIVAFLCNWCSYAAADLAGVRRLKYPPNVRIVRVPCTGNVSPYHILYAFNKGADGVLVSGCSPGDCHYRNANLHARRRFQLLRNVLSFVGFEENRIHFAWISASEADLFVKTVGEVTERVRTLGPFTYIDNIRAAESNAH
ncbi:MAG: hydrogenase iron-sulfur subunit [Pseudomonadota bacterium]